MAFKDGLAVVPAAGTWEQIRRILSVIAAVIAALMSTQAVRMHSEERQARQAYINLPPTSPAHAK